MQQLPKIGLPALVLGFILVIFISKSSINIGYGEAGVLFKTFGGGVVIDEPPLGEGFHIIAPWNKVYIYNVKQQEVFESKMQVLSSNGLEISLDISVLYQPKIEDLGKLHKTKGENYLNIIIIPQIRAVARSVVGRYTPEQLYSTKRDAIQNEIYEETKKVAIERKLNQEQEALEYEFRIEKAKREAERQRIDAEGKAAANRILSASLTDKILQEKGIEATMKLSESPNSKVIVIGGGEGGLPIILGNQ